MFLTVFGQKHDIAATRRDLLEGALPHRSRATRESVVSLILQRLVRWSTPQWVLDDLIQFATDGTSASLASALLIHVTRQDHLLYDFVQQMVAPRWIDGPRTVIRSDAQGFLDRAVPAHPEIDRWTRSTRDKVAGNVLTILRDYGLLRGSVRGSPRKEIVEPSVPSDVARHLVQLLLTEGIEYDEIPNHPDWRIWLWDMDRTRTFVTNASAGRENVP